MTQRTIKIITKITLNIIRIIPRVISAENPANPTPADSREAARNPDTKSIRVKNRLGRGGRGRGRGKDRGRGDGRRWGKGGGGEKGRKGEEARRRG